MVCCLSSSGDWNFVGLAADGSYSVMVYQEFSNYQVYFCLICVLGVQYSVLVEDNNINV